MNKVPNPIKVVYVIGQLTVGGTERQLLELIRNLNRDKFKILVVCLTNHAPLVDSFIEAGCDLHILDRERRGRLLILWDLYRLFSEFRPDIIHSYAYTSRASIPISKLFLRCKNVVSIRTQPGWQVLWFDRFLDSFADYVLTNSQKAVELSHFGNVPCRVIYNGIDLRKFDVDMNKPNLALASPVNSDTKVICVVARLHPVKGLDVLLDAFMIVSKELDNIQLWIIGDGQDREKLERQANQSGIDSKVIFWGEQKNIPALLQRVDIGILSSHVEGLPNAIIEYMAAHLPVVATNVGGIPELITHNVNGLLVEPKNPNKLAQAILILLKDPGLAKKLGENGRLYIQKNFDTKKMVEETEKIYRELCPLR